MKLLPLNSKIVGEKNCPPHFLVTTFKGAMAPTIYFSYEDKDGKAQLGTVPLNRSVVYITTEDKATYEKIPVDGLTGAAFRMTQKVYEEDRACLSAPTPDTEK